MCWVVDDGREDEAARRRDPDVCAAASASDLGCCSESKPGWKVGEQFGVPEDRSR